MKKLLFILLIISVVILTGCITKEKCAKYYPPQITKSDSIRTVTTTKIHDSIIRIPSDSSWLTALIECDKKGQAYLQEVLHYKVGSNTAGIPQIKFKHDTAYIECNCDSVKIHAILKDRETVINHKSDTTITPPAIEVKYIPGWMWFFGITGMIAWGAGLLFAIYKLVKLKLKLPI